MVYNKKTLAQIKSNIILNLMNNVDAINDANIGSIVDMIVTSLSQEMEEQYNDLDTVYNGTRISTATGDNLDELGNIVGVERNVGSKTTGHVSFIKDTIPSVQFSVTEGTIVSTQPNTDLFQFKYIVTQDTTFKTEITNETQTFINGIYEYIFVQRLVNNITEIRGTVGGSPHTFVDTTDYDLQKSYDDLIIIVKDNGTLLYTLVDDCEVVTGWVEGDEADTTTVNSVIFYQDSNALNLLKSGATSVYMSYSKTLGSVIDIGDKSMFMSLYIADSTVLSKIDKVEIWNGSSSGIVNAYKFDFFNTDLQVGWNRLVLDRLDSKTVTLGNPDNININHLKIMITTDNATDTFSANDFVMDFWFLAQYKYYQGDIIKYDKEETLPDSNTEINVDYVPLSLEVPVEAYEIGANYNVSRGKVMYQVTVNPFIDRIYNYESFTGGVDIENDVNLKDRVQNATQLKTNATATAIRFNVLDLPFVKSVSIIDMPMRHIDDEEIVFDVLITKYSLKKEVAQDDSNFEIRTAPAGGGTAYTKNTDYILTSFTNEIEWLGINDPADGASFYVSYDYRDLGVFLCYVVGQGGSLTSSQLTEVETVVENTRSASVQGVVVEPSYITTNVEINLKTSGDFTRAVVESDVESNINEYINNLNVGGDVLLAGLIDVIMDADGVENVLIISPVTDVTINSDEKAQPGNIIINAW